MIHDSAKSTGVASPEMMPGMMPEMMNADPHSRPAGNSSD